MAENWHQAVALLSKTFEEAIKAIPARRIRLTLANNTKQFKYMCKLMDAREELIKDLQQRIANEEEESTRARKEVDDLKKNRKTLQVKLDKFQHQNGDLQNKLVRILTGSFPQLVLGPLISRTRDRAGGGAGGLEAPNFWATWSTLFRLSSRTYPFQKTKRSKNVTFSKFIMQISKINSGGTCSRIP